MKKLFTTVFFVICILNFCKGQQLLVDPAFPEIAGEVHATCLDSATNTLYVGGLFNKVGTLYNYCLQTDTGGNIPSDWPEPNSPVYASIPDGNGGYFIGGSFDVMGDSLRDGVSHVNGNGTISNWKLPFFNSSAEALALRNDTLFMGGYFEIYGIYNPFNFAAVNANTGSFYPLNPSINWNINCMLPVGHWLFIGGYRNRVPSSKYEGFTAIDLRTGLIDTSIYLNLDTTGIIKSFAIKGDTLFIGGKFGTVSGGVVTRRGLAAFSLTTKKILNWNPSIPTNDVRELRVGKGKLYVCGLFPTVNAQPRKGIASFYLSNLSLTNWAPQLVGDTVSNINFAVGKMVANANNIYLIDTITGATKALDFGPNINTISTNGTHFFVGGSFYDFGGIHRNNLAAINLNTNAITSWNPNVTGTMRWPIVNAMVKVGNKIYIGGQFTKVGGVSRNNLAALDVNGNVQSWSPAVKASDTTTSINSLCVVGNTLYAGGRMDTVNGTIRHNFAAFDLTTGNLASFAPVINKAVNVVAANNGTLYLGGAFTSINSQTRRRIASFSLSTLALNSWAPDIDTGEVKCLAFSSNKLFAGGRFNTVNKTPKFLLTDFDLATGNVGNLKAFFDNIFLDNAIEGATVFNNQLYVGGEISTFQLGVQYTIADINLASDSMVYWNPPVIQRYPDQYGNAFSFKDKLIFSLGFGSYSGGKTNNGTLKYDYFPPTLSAGNINSTYCAGNSFSVPYTSNITFNNGNLFTVKLINASGNPLTIGTQSGVASSGSINVTIPSSVTFSNYSIKIFSSNPVDSSVNSSSFSITKSILIPQIKATPGVNICPDSTSISLNAGSGYSSYNWSNAATTQNISVLNSGNYSVSVNSSNGCTAQNSIVITKNYCSTPTGITVGSIQSTSARIVWTVQDCAYNTQLHYRVFGTTIWTQIGINAPTNARTLINLTPATKYEFQLRTKCSANSNIYSAWSNTQTFTTKVASCSPPTNVTAGNLQQTRATISWTATAGAYSYKLRTRLKGTTAWTNRVILAPTIAKVLTGLTANTAYEYQVQTICDVSGTPASNFTAIQSFTTTLRMEQSGQEVSDLILYPNPTSEKLTVSSEHLTGSELMVTDMLGRIYIDEKVTVDGNTTMLDVSNLASGVYFVTLKTEKGSEVKKFVKE